MNRWVELLKRKFGPLPAWAWFVLLAAGVYYYRKHKAATTPTPATDTTAVVPPATTDVSGNGSGYIYYPPGSQPPPSSTPPPVGSPPPPSSGFATQIWIHGNPGHTYTYTGDPSVSAWFQLDGQWYYYSAVPESGYPGSAYPQGSPYMPPGAGQPPGGGQASTQTGSNAGVTITGNRMIPVDPHPHPGTRPRLHWEGPPLHEPVGKPTPNRPGLTAGAILSRLRTNTGRGKPTRQRQPVPTATGAPRGARDRLDVTPGPSPAPSRHRSPAVSKTGSARPSRRQRTSA